MRATKRLPPIKLPKMTGHRFEKKPDQEISSVPGNDSKYFKNNPIGMMYILAILCSKPAATNALTGNKITIILSITLRPACAIHTAKQTSTLHIKPLKKAC